MQSSTDHAAKTPSSCTPDRYLLLRAASKYNTSPWDDDAIIELLTLEFKQKAGSQVLQSVGNPTENTGRLLFHRKSKTPCVVVLGDKQYADGHTEKEPIGCELQGEDLNGLGHHMVKVMNLPLVHQSDDIESGVTTIFDPGADINDDTNEIIFPSDSRVSVSSSDPTDSSCIFLVLLKNLRSTFSRFGTAWFTRTRWWWKCYGRQW